MKKVLRVLLIILAVLMGIIVFIQMIADDFQISPLLLCIVFIVISKLLKEENSNKNDEDVSNTGNINTVPVSKLEKNTIMVINEIYTLLGEGTVVLGEVLQDSIEPGTYVLIKTQNGKTMETQILNFREKVEGVNRAIDRAYKGNYITVGLRGIARDEICVGDIICYKEI